jgi:protein-S-isoprenylcysteine O-methyltransferase Ste14
MLGVMSAIDPELRQERFRPAPGGQDRHFRWIVLPFLLAHLVVAGLDVGRFGWSREVPPTVHAAGLVGVALCLGLVCRAMTANRFFSPVVRIQQERGHHVVMTGPYRYVRHPGYVGGMLAALCGAVVLGSWWSMVPLAPYLLLFVRRAAMEDRFLQRELEGYAEYAKQVRYRLVPGVW